MAKSERDRVAVTDSFSIFGHKVWSRLCFQPLGSLTKRELELSLLRAATDSGLLEEKAERLAATCHIPISRAHGYLTDLALRQPPLADIDGVKRLIELLKGVEVLPEDSYFSIPLHDAALKVWLERKMAVLQLNSGDTLRRDHVKLTPAGLTKLIGSCDGIVSPYEAIRKLPPELAHVEWVKAAKRVWRKGIGWAEALGALGNTVTIGQAVFPYLLLF